MDSKRISKRKLIEHIHTKINDTINDSDILRKLSKSDLLNIMNVLEDTVYENLKKATEKESIIIALFEGLNIESVYIPQKTKQNNLTGKVILTTSKIKPKATFTRTCCEKLSKDVR